MMDGLTRIIEKIEAESAQRCAEVIAQAEKKAQEIAESTKADLERQYAEADAASDEAAKAVVVRALASVQQQKKQAILKAKMQVINDAIAHAEQAFLAMPDKEYFVALSALIMPTILVSVLGAAGVIGTVVNYMREKAEGGE